MIQEPEDLPESQTIRNFLVDSGKGDINVCFGRMVGYDPDFRKEFREFFCKAVSYKRSADSLKRDVNKNVGAVFTSVGATLVVARITAPTSVNCRRLSVALTGFS